MKQPADCDSNVVSPPTLLPPLPFTYSTLSTEHLPSSLYFSSLYPSPLSSLLSPFPPLLSLLHFPLPFPPLPSLFHPHFPSPPSLHSVNFLLYNPSQMTFPLNLTVFSLNFSHFKNWALTVDTSHPNDDGMYDVTFKVYTTGTHATHHTHTLL